MVDSVTHSPQQRNGTLREESQESERPLRTGLTTGVCATAGALAAATRLLAGRALTAVTVELPRHAPVQLAIHDLEATQTGAVAGVIKDGGDDPDATHGARVWTQVEHLGEPGVTFRAGAGVGTVTRPGLPLPPGEPAINPVPRRMIQDHLERLAAHHHHAGGFQVTVGVDDGQRIAERTMNPRLGIVGGISILGTTGIVRPFSCAAYIASIHQSIDVANATGLPHVACCTGSSSEWAVQALYGLADSAVIEMGDFFGAALKHLRRHPRSRVTIAAGFGKLSKFAQGHLDTHSRKCAIDPDFLAEHAVSAGAPDALAQQIRAAHTALEALQLASGHGIDLARPIAEAAWHRARHYLAPPVVLDVVAVDREGSVLARAAEEAP